MPKWAATAPISLVMAAYSLVRSAWSAPESMMQRVWPERAKSYGIFRTAGAWGSRKSMATVPPTAEAI